MYVFFLFIHHSSIEIVLLTDCNILHILIVTGHYLEIFIFLIIFLSQDIIYLKKCPRALFIWNIALGHYLFGKMSCDLKNIVLLTCDA